MKEEKISTSTTNNCTCPMCGYPLTIYWKQIAEARTDDKKQRQYKLHCKECDAELHPTELLKSQPNILDQLTESLKTVAQENLHKNN